MREREREETREQENKYRDNETSFTSNFERYRQEVNCEYGDEGFEIEHNGKDSYRLVLDDPQNVYDHKEFVYNVQQKFNYRGLRDIIRKLNLPIRSKIKIPSFEFLRDSQFLEQIDLRMNSEGELIGLKYKPIAGNRYIDIIVKERDGLRFSNDKKQPVQNAIKDFNERVNKLDETYSLTPKGITEEYVNEEVFGLENGTELTDEQIWERNEITNETRLSTFRGAEDIMNEYRDEILEDIKQEGWRIPDTESGMSFYDHSVFLTDTISNMDWYEEEGWSMPQKRPSGEVYEKELDTINDSQKDIKERERTAENGDQIKLYAGLGKYLDYKELTLKTYFDKPINEPRIVQLYRRVMETKAGKLVAKKFPKILVGGIISVVATVFGILDIAQSMAEDVVDEGEKAVKKLSKNLDYARKTVEKMGQKVLEGTKKTADELEKKLEKMAEEQKNTPAYYALETLGKTFHSGSDGINFVQGDFWWFAIILSALIFLIILILFLT